MFFLTPLSHSLGRCSTEFQDRAAWIQHPKTHLEVGNPLHTKHPFGWPHMKNWDKHLLAFCLEMSSERLTNRVRKHFFRIYRNVPFSSYLPWWAFIQLGNDLMHLNVSSYHFLWNNGNSSQHSVTCIITRYLAPLNLVYVTKCWFCP